MIERLNPASRRDPYGPKINRDHSPVLVHGVPWLTVVLGSLAPLLPVIAPAPIMPPWSYLFLLSWGLLRPGLFPLWAGLPLGLVDDLFSGQPAGSAIVLFSLTLIALDLVDLRFPWRNVWHNWLLAGLMLGTYLLATLLFSGASLNLRQAGLLIPQFLLALVLVPVVLWLTAALDRLRLRRIRRIG